MTNQDSFDWKGLFDEAKELNRLKPWEFIDDNQIFVVVDPVSGENLYCSILGGNAEEFGLSVYIGQAGLQAIQDIMKMEDSYLNIFLRQRSLLLSFVDRNELEQDDYDLIKSQGLSYRGKKQWVMFRSYIPGNYPWLINEEEGRMLRVAIEQTKVVCDNVKKGESIPVLHSEAQDFVARVPVEKDGAIEWGNEVIRVKESHVREPDAELVIPELDLTTLQRYGRRNNSVEFDMFHVDIPVQEIEGERPCFPMMAVAIDRKTGTVKYQNLFHDPDRIKQAQQAFIEFVEHSGARPRELWIHEDMAPLLAPLTKPLRIDVMAVERLQHIEQVRKYLEDKIRSSS